MAWWRNTFAPTSSLGLSAFGRWAPAACVLLLHRLLLKASVGWLSSICLPAAVGESRLLPICASGLAAAIASKLENGRQEARCFCKSGPACLPAACLGSRLRKLGFSCQAVAFCKQPAVQR